MDDREQRPSRPPARKPSGPNSQRRREDLPARGGSSARAGAPRQTRDGSDPRGARPAPMDRDQSRLRPRIFEPDIPEDVTGEELEKSVRAELLSLSAENAKVVARHLVCINLYQDTDPQLAHKHGIAAAHHAGRLAVVRESAGYAAYRAGHYEIALKELRAANRISGDVSSSPHTDCFQVIANYDLKPQFKRLENNPAFGELCIRMVAERIISDLAENTMRCADLDNEPIEGSLHEKMQSLFSDLNMDFDSLAREYQQGSGQDKMQIVSRLSKAMQRSNQIAQTLSTVKFGGYRKS